MWTEEMLMRLDAKELKGAEAFDAWKNGEYIGTVMGSYGDFNYYRLPDGTYGFEYMSIGD